jgi:hypothetical protein
MAASGPGAMTGPSYGSLEDDSSDDLPRTFRREKEARAREARERAAQERAAAPSLPNGPEGRSTLEPQIYRSADIEPNLDDVAVTASVRRFDVPFVDLVMFLLKVVVAGIPALILLGVILWFAGTALQVFFPSLIKMKILISFPN